LNVSAKDIDSVEDAARTVLVNAGAIRICGVHAFVAIRTGDKVAERLAYGDAANLLKSDGEPWNRSVLVRAMRRDLGRAVVECPQCTRIREG
jgi:hypothetical protein